MGGSASTSVPVVAEKVQTTKNCEDGACPIVEKPKLKPCCACPETKKARDKW